MSLFSPAYNRGFRRGFRQGRRRGRRRVFYAQDPNAGQEFPAAEGSFSDDESFSDSEEFFSDGDDLYSDEEYYSDEEQIAEPAAAPAPQEPSPTMVFYRSMMQKHGMIGTADPDNHPSSKGLVPLEKVGCYDGDVIVLECVEVEPECEEEKKEKKKDECYEEKKEDECDKEEKEDECYEEKKEDECEKPKKKDPCEKKEPCYEEVEEDDELSLDNTVYYDCWVKDGDKTEYKKREHPDDCDEIPEEEICSPADKVRAGLSKAMKAGKEFSGRMKTQFISNNEAGVPVTQKAQLHVKGKYANKAYQISVEIAGCDEDGKVIAASAGSADLFRVKLDANKQFSVKTSKKGTAALRAQSVPRAAIEHAIVVVNDLVQGK